MIDKPKFAKALTHIGDWNGGRVRDLRIQQPNTPHDVVGAAIAVSILNGLQGMAEAKLLSGKDIQVVIDAFMVSADVEAYEGTMGGTMFRRKGAA